MAFKVVCGLFYSPSHVSTFNFFIFSDNLPAFQFPVTGSPMVGHLCLHSSDLKATTNIQFLLNWVTENKLIHIVEVSSNIF